LTAPAPAPVEWHRLHPLSPIVRAVPRLPAPIVLLVVGAGSSRAGGDPTASYVGLGTAVLVLVLSTVHWLVTRWALDDTTLWVETGLLRRDSRQLPVTRIQAVDLVRPFMARATGTAELRIRMAGSGRSDARLAFLADTVAEDLRARLLAMHHGLDAATPEPPEYPLARVANGQLVASIFLSGLGMTAMAIFVALIVVGFVAPHAAAGLVSGSFVYLISLIAALWRRLGGECNFVAAEAPDGVRIRRGLIQTVAETIPIGRVQSVRIIEPLLWRPFGWSRLEVDIAGSVGGDRRTQSQSGLVTKALLPVGRRDAVQVLIDRVLRAPIPGSTPPPRQARFKAPLSYHFLAAGYSETHVVAVTGRLRRLTACIPLEKVQSTRWVQGPIQRRMGLANVQVDAAGRRVKAVLKDRGLEESRHTLTEIPERSRAARTKEGTVLNAVMAPEEPAPATAPGWFPDPAGRHQHRWWDGTRWSDHVADQGRAGVDPLSINP
jgi:putative membrane protein